MFPPFLSGLAFKFAMAAIAVVAIVLTVQHIRILGHERDAARAGEQIAVAAAKANEQAIDRLKAEGEAATVARRQAEKRNAAYAQRLKTASKVIDNADPAKECPVSDSLRAALDSLRRQPAERGDAGQGRTGPAPARVARVPR